MKANEYKHYILGQFFIRDMDMLPTPKDGVCKPAALILEVARKECILQSCL